MRWFRSLCNLVCLECLNITTWSASLLQHSQLWGAHSSPFDSHIVLHEYVCPHLFSDTRRISAVRLVCCFHKLYGPELVAGWTWIDNIISNYRGETPCFESACEGTLVQWEGRSEVFEQCIPRSGFRKTFPSWVVTGAKKSKSPVS